MEAWEVQDAEFDVKDLKPSKFRPTRRSSRFRSPIGKGSASLAMEKRNAPTGLVSGVSIPPELQGSIGKQLAEFAKMGITRDNLPKDFASLAQKTNEQRTDRIAARHRDLLSRQYRHERGFVAVQRS